MRRITTTLTRSLLVLAVAVALCGCSPLYFRTLNTGGGDGVTTSSFDYAPGRGLDLYVPAARARPAPVVLFLYGGRWQDGSRSDYAFVGKQLAEHGVLTAVADYRRFPQVRFPVFVEDAALAVAWLRQHAADHGGDPQRLFVAGHSAGAHIAAMLGTDRRYLAAVGMQPQDLAGVIGIAGPYDFVPLTDDDLIDIFGPEADWPASQPVNFVDGDEPPFLLLHGDDDLLVWPRNSIRLAARLQQAGVAVEFRRYPDLGHIRILAAVRYPKLAPTLEDVLRFVWGED